MPYLTDLSERRCCATVPLKDPRWVGLVIPKGNHTQKTPELDITIS